MLVKQITIVCICRTERLVIPTQVVRTMSTSKIELQTLAEELVNYYGGAEELVRLYEAARHPVGSTGGCSPLSVEETMSQRTMSQIEARHTMGVLQAMNSGPSGDGEPGVAGVDPLSLKLWSGAALDNVDSVVDSTDTTSYDALDIPQRVLRLILHGLSDAACSAGYSLVPFAVADVLELRRRIARTGSESVFNGGTLAPPSPTLVDVALRNETSAKSVSTLFETVTDYIDQREGAANPRMQTPALRSAEGKLVRGVAGTLEGVDGVHRWGVLSQCFPRKQDDRTWDICFKAATWFFLAFSLLSDGRAPAVGGEGDATDMERDRLGTLLYRFAHPSIRS
jgi:hypothetical protein